MWAEARRQEKKIRGIMVDYKKRAERRREYYEKIRQDPTQFLRLHGRPCKINLEQSVAEAAESPATMMPWQGDNTNMIDRFDVRAHLDMIPAINPIKPKLTPEEEKDERRCNYERYRILVQNEYAGISEEQCLKQIEVDETFPIHSKSRENQKAETKKAAIGFTYEDSTPAETEEEKTKGWEEEDESDDSVSSVSDIDLDVEIDIEALADDQKQQVNVLGEKFGMGKTNMVRNLEREREEAEDFKRAKEEEAEKALYSGRKSRRERRALIEKRLRERRGEQMSPPSYAQRGSPDYTLYKNRSSSSSSRSRSRSPVDSGKVTFITSFGGEEDKSGEKGGDKTTTAAPQKDGSKASKKHSTSTLSSSKTRGRSASTSSNSSSSSGSATPERPPKPPRSPNTSRSSSSSSSRSRERNPKPKRRSKTKSRSRSRERTHSSQSRSSRSRRSRSDSRSYSGSRSHSKYEPRKSKPSRSRSRDKGRRSRSRSPIRKERARSRSKSRERKQIPKSDNSNSKIKKKESVPVSTPAFKANSVKSLTPQEKMRLRMQKALNKQHKADKIREIKKKEEKYQAEQDREDELRETMWKMRRREREKMEKEREERDRQKRDYSSSSDSSEEDSPERRHSKQSSRQQSRRYSRSLSRSKSRSASPPPRGHRR